MAASSKPMLLPAASDPAPAPWAATRPRLITFRANLIFCTLVFGVAMCDNWGDGERLAYLVCGYIVVVAFAVSMKCTDQFPRGSAAAAWAWRANWISLAGLAAVSFYQLRYMQALAESLRAMSSSAA